MHTCSVCGKTLICVREWNGSLVCGSAACLKVIFDRKENHNA